MIFSIFRFLFCTLSFQIYNLSQILSNHNKPFINRNIIHSDFRGCININLDKFTLMTGFVVQGHIYDKHTGPLNSFSDVMYQKSSLTVVERL